MLHVYTTSIIMQLNLFLLIASCSFNSLCLCLRRLTGGEYTRSKKTFMVYIVKSNRSSQDYDNWLCGGAIISPYQVITSASCLTEVSNVYVIAGYNKYVNGRGIDLNACTKKRKNRVLKTCVPKTYNLSATDQSKWMALDIGVAIVEHPFNFSDTTWRRDCSYMPNAIRISYDERLQLPGTDVLAYGWGGSYWRTNTDVLDNNSAHLQEIRSLIVDKDKCKDKFDGEGVKRVIRKYMVCVNEYGNLDGSGKMLHLGPKTRQGCRRSGNGSECKFDIDSKRKLNVIQKKPILVPSRRQSLCQNDHGGPLVTWIGSEEVLIGVACTSIVDVNTQICTTPSVFTSTYCTGMVVACLIAITSSSRRQCAEQVKMGGIDIHGNDVDWTV